MSLTMLPLHWAQSFESLTSSQAGEKGLQGNNCNNNRNKQWYKYYKPSMWLHNTLLIGETGEVSKVGTHATCCPRTQAEITSREAKDFHFWRWQQMLKCKVAEWQRHRWATFQQSYIEILSCSSQRTMSKLHFFFTLLFPVVLLLSAYWCTSVEDFVQW